MPGEDKSFWQTTTGTVTAVATMVAALAGVVPVIMAVRGSDNGKPAGTATPTPTASVTEASPSTGGDGGRAPGESGPPPVIASPAEVNFGKVPPLTNPTQGLQLVNTGQDAVTVEGIEIVGPQKDSFGIVEGTCKEGAELTPDAPCDLKIRFTPSGSSEQHATLVVKRTPGDDVRVELSGNPLL